MVAGLTSVGQDSIITRSFQHWTDKTVQMAPLGKAKPTRITLLGNGMRRGSSALEAVRLLEPLIVESDDTSRSLSGLSGGMRVVLGVESASIQQLDEAARQLANALGNGSVVEKTFLSDDKFGLVLRLGRDLTSDRRAELVDLVGPRFTCRADAKARIERDGTGRHIGTIVTLTFEDGAAAIKLTSGEIERRVSDVARARVSDCDGKVVFSLTNFAHSGQDEVDEVATDVALLLGAYLRKPVVISDTRPDFALLEFYDAVKPTDDTEVSAAAPVPALT